MKIKFMTGVICGLVGVYNLFEFIMNPADDISWLFFITGTIFVVTSTYMFCSEDN